jgi:hypothetical protein
MLDDCPEPFSELAGKRIGGMLRDQRSAIIQWPMLCTS